MAEQQHREFGARLAELREGKGWTQQEAADAIGVTRVTLARWEGGYHVPEHPQFESVASAYDIRADELRALCGLVVGAPYDLSLWALGMARRIDRRAARLPRALLPHSIRHNCATRLARRGVELDAIRELLGHSSIATTAVYLHTDQARLREIADLAGLETAQPQEEQTRVADHAGQEQAPWRRAAWRRERRAG